MLLTTPLTLLVIGCGAGENTAPSLKQVVPASAYSDSAISVRLLGGPFHPPVQVDTYSGSADVSAAPFQISFDPSRPMGGRRSIAGIDPTWIDDQEIDAKLPPGMLAGVYSVSLRDAAGNAIASSATFTSLGPDIDPPHIVFLGPMPATVFAPGETITVDVRVDDGAGQVRSVQWSASSPGFSPLGPTSCTPDENGVCEFTLTAQAGPDVLDPINITVEAEDDVHNVTSGYLTVDVAWKPTITSISPPENSTAGGKPIAVYGRSFVVNLSQILIDGMSIGGVVDPSGSMIQAVTTMHVPGDAQVAVSNGDSVSASLPFTFIPPPILKLINPSHAYVDTPSIDIDISGNNFRPETEFYWTQGDSSDRNSIPYAPPANVSPIAPYERLCSPSRVTLTLLPGEGTITIVAHDPVSNDSTLVDAFTFDSAP